MRPSRFIPKTASDSAGASAYVMAPLPNRLLTSTHVYVYVQL